MPYTAKATFVGSSPDAVDRLIDTANQVYQLSRIGYLATESQENGMIDPEAAFCGLFEVMARLADELRGQLDEIDDHSPEFRHLAEAVLGTDDPRPTARPAAQSDSGVEPVPDFPKGIALDGSALDFGLKGPRKPKGPAQ